MKLLVENGADVNSDNGMSMTPISFAKMFGHEEIVKYLLSKNAKKPGLKESFLKLFVPLIKGAIKKKSKN